MPLYEFTGADPIDHFHLGRIDPGAVVELDARPAGEWKPSKRKRPTSTEPGSDTPTTEQED